MAVRSLDEDGFWERFIVEHVCNIDFRRYELNPSILTSQILDKSTSRAIDEIEAMGNYVNTPVTFSNFRYFLHDIEFISVGYQVLAQLILEAGARLPESIKDKVLSSTSLEYDKRWGWDTNRLKIRKFYLNEFRRHINNYKEGDTPCFRTLEIASDNELEVSSIGLTELYSNIKFKRCYIIRYINLQCCNLDSLPSELFEFKFVERLDLSRNLLRELPDDFGELQSLKIINLSHNHLQSLPKSFQGLINLNRLNLCYNRIKVLPSWFRHLESLYDLYLEGNPIKE